MANPALMQTVYRGQPFVHRGVSLHKRIPWREGESGSEPATYWLTITMPWKQLLWDIPSDDMIRKHPHWSIGLRFHRS